MKKKTIFAMTFALIASATITSCGSSADEAKKEEATTETAEATTEEVAEAPAEAAAINGEELFTSSGCVACHQAETKTVGPALKDIAAAYADNTDGLVSFLNGEGEAIVDPAQAAVMQPQTEVTKAMSDEERNAIADYIMNI